MIGSEHEQSVHAQHRRRPSRWTTCAIVLALALAASFAAVALAVSTSVTIGSASNATLNEQIAVTSQGRTLYTLSGETASHLKCKTKECFKFWPPLTVSSRKTKLKAGPGVKGPLGILRRSNGTFQVTARGMPVYRYFEDHATGQANGQDIKSFGGTWHALPAGGETKATTPPPATTPEPMPYTSTPTTPTTSTPTTPSPPYGY